MTNSSVNLLSRLFSAIGDHSLTPVQDGTDWESLISVAANECLLPSLYERVTGISGKLNIPSEITAYFNAVAELNRERNQAILSQLRDITASLNGANIEPIVLKGLAYILTGTYKDPAARYVSDIDFLVPAAQLATAMQVLQDAGYQPDENDPVASFRHHLPTFSRPRCLPVELHHSVGLGVCQKLLPSAELIRDSSLLTWNGVRLRIPSPDHLITHLVIHSQLLHPYVEHIWPPLRALYDLALLQRRFTSAIHWPTIEKRFRSQHQYPTLVLHLLQAEQTLGTPRPIAVSPNWFNRLRWGRRQLIRRFPKSRFVDPIFFFHSTLSRRAPVVKNMLLSGGWQQVIKRLFKPSLYRRLASEITNLNQ